MVVLVIIGLAMVILAVLFVFQNATVVAINLGVWQFKQSLAIVLISTLGLGIMISLLLSTPTILKRGWQNSRPKKQIAELETQLQSQDRTNSHQQKQDLAKQNALQELLRAFNLSAQITTLSSKNTTVQLTEHLLQQIQNQSSNPRYSSLTVMLFAVMPAKSQRNFTDVDNENSLYKAIAQRFSHGIIPHSFLGISPRQLLLNLILGLKGKEATEYANYLQGKITAVLLQKTDGTLLELSKNVGGVIVAPTDMVDSRSILKQAEQNLEQSLVKGRGYLNITDITTKTT